MRAIQVIVLAAGGGTRMKSELPKVLHPVCGRPMIAYALDLAAASGGGKPPIVVLGGETAEAIKPYLPKEVTLVVQKTPLGTGDAVVAAKRVVGGFSGDLLILYADTLLIRRTTIQRLIESHYKSTATCTLLTAHLADPSGYGRVVRDAVGVISGIVEEADANALQRAIREINVGPICVKAQPLFEILAEVKPSAVKKEWYLTKAVALLARREGTKFQAARVEEASEALGVNSRAELVRATGIIRQRILEGHLHNGVAIVDPSTTFIDHGVVIGQDTTIQPCTVIETGVVIGKRCSIGPFARLRNGVNVADEVRIGNFVELVRTKVGARARLNHMTYLGDATVEEDVNIGAGTITANFDGRNKLPTTIGKGAFIGCDTVLIAPVKVGAGAVTGAGSVIPKDHDVPPRGIVVGVPARPIGQTDGKADGHGKPEHPAEAVVGKAAVKLPASRLIARAKPTPLLKRRVVTRIAKKAKTNPPRKLRVAKPRVRGARQPARSRTPARRSVRVKAKARRPFARSRARRR